MRRALVIGPGGLRGAYSAGVVATLGRKLGTGYFDTVYGCSAGAYTASYLVSSQPDMIEAIWRECVHGSLLVRPRNVLRKEEPILDLFYLNDVLRSKKYQLSMESLLGSSTQLVIVATERKTRVPQYFSPRTEEEFFLQVRASAAIPLLHPGVIIDGNVYIDGVFSDRLPYKRALADGHSEVIVVHHKQPAKKHLSPNVRFIVPSEEMKHRWQLDRSKERINELVDLGIRDALAFL
jgi:predicted patatin/cPLA2 family phospholipase